MLLLPTFFCCSYFCTGKEEKERERGLALNLLHWTTYSVDHVALFLLTTTSAQLLPLFTEKKEVWKQGSVYSKKNEYKVGTECERLYRKPVVVIRGKIFNFKMYTTFMEMSVTWLSPSYENEKSERITKTAKAGKSERGRKSTNTFFLPICVCYSSFFSPSFSLSTYYISLHYITLHHVILLSQQENVGSFSLEKI